jgi:hypothetical protein
MHLPILVYVVAHLLNQARHLLVVWGLVKNIARRIPDCDRAVSEAAGASVNLVHGYPLKLQEQFWGDISPLGPLRDSVENKTSLDHAIARFQALFFRFVAKNRSLGNCGCNIGHFRSRSAFRDSIALSISTIVIPSFSRRVFP